MKKYVFAAMLMAGTALSGMAISAAADSVKAPVRRVILSTSGMAHFEHRAQVSGDAVLQLPARLDQVDDMLKSLVVIDPKGRLGGITMPGRQPLQQIFRDMPFTPQDLNSPVALLNALQGAAISISGPEKASGKLLRVVAETVETEGGRAFVQRHRLSLLSPEGLKQVVLEDLSAVKFEDAGLQAQLETALAAVRAHATQDRRQLDIALKGTEAREVGLAYVVEAPLWKSAYRMVLPRPEGKEGLLQGWAVVENMTGNDWDDVELVLVSGNPVTYHQALYQSYHVTRPELPVEVLGRVLPRVDGGVLQEAEADGMGGMGGAGSAVPSAPAKALEMKKAMRAARNEARMQGLMTADSAEGFADMPMPMAAPAEEMAGYGIADFASGAQAVQGADAAAQVLFRFPDSFDLGAGQTMMLPFVSGKVMMERVSLYQPETSAAHPLAAVRVKNAGETGLPPGIVTLYEESAALGGTSYVGDAQLPVLAKGEERLVSYALDSKTQISREDKSTQRQGTLAISQGVMRWAVKYVSETVYTIKAPAEEARTVVLEHPKMGGDYKIVQPLEKDVDVTATHYRITAPVKAGETKKVTVQLEQDGWQSYAIRDLSSQQFEAWASGSSGIDAKTRAVFEKLAELRRAVDGVDQKLQQQDMRRQEIYNDQNRLRENLKSLEGESDIKRRYLERLNAQETELQKIEEQAQGLQQERQKRMADLEKYIAGLKI